MIRLLTIAFYMLATVGIGMTAYTVIIELWAEHKIDTVIVLFGLLALATTFGDVIVKNLFRDDEVK